MNLSKISTKKLCKIMFKRCLNKENPWVRLMEQKQPIAHSGLSFSYFQQQLELCFAVQREKNQRLTLQDIYKWLFGRWQWQPKRNISMSCCNSQMWANLIYSVFMVLYYQVCLAYSQILMKSSMYPEPANVLVCAR